MTIEIGNIVSIRGLVPKVRMVVLSKAPCSPWGFGGDYNELFWLDENDCPHTQFVQSELLELQGL